MEACGCDSECGCEFDGDPTDKQIIADLREELRQVDLALCQVEDQADLEDPEIMGFYIGVCGRIREGIDELFAKHNL